MNTGSSYNERNSRLTDPFSDWQMQESLSSDPTYYLTPLIGSAGGNGHTQLAIGLSSSSDTSNQLVDSPILTRVLTALNDVRPCGEGCYMACCPAHEDHDPSLSIRDANGTVRLHCFAGCQTRDVLAALHLAPGDLRSLHDDLLGAAETTANVCGGTVEDIYEYENGEGKPVFAVARFTTPDGGKTYRPFHAEAGGWKVGDPEGSLPLYHLRRLGNESPVYVVEGEKCAEAAWSIGLTATTSAHGAESPRKTDWAPLAGHEVIILPDNDSPGQKYAKEVAKILQKLNASSVKVVQLPDLPESGDIVDFIAARQGQEPEAIAQEIKLLVAQPASPAGTSGGDGKTTAAGPSAPDNSDPPHFTDLGNAQRLVWQHGSILHYIPARGKWLMWRQGRWAYDETNQIMQVAKQTVKAMYAEAAQVTSDKERAALARHALHSESEARLRAMVTLAQSEDGIPLTPDKLDVNSWLLNVQNGTIDLKTGQLHRHNQHDLLTRIIDVPFDPNAKCPHWDSMLRRIFGDDSPISGFLQRAAGYSLTGDVSEQVLFFLYGLGANAKTTFTRALLNLLGPYATQAAPDLLIVKRREGHPTSVADLQGHRMVVTAEVENGQLMAEALVKQLTGGDRMKARFMRQDFFAFDPTHKLWLIANHKPQIRGTDHAIWRRILVVPFTTTIPENEKDPQFLAKLMGELPGILAWAVRGCQDWLKSGLNAPPEVTSATQRYRQEMDVLADFLEEECVLHELAKVRVKDLYDRYCKWCSANNEYSLSKIEFRTRLLERGLGSPRKSTGGDVYWFGIGLKSKDQRNDSSGEVEWSGPVSGSLLIENSSIAEIPMELHSPPLAEPKISADIIVPADVPNLTSVNIDSPLVNNPDSGNQEAW